MPKKSERLLGLQKSIYSYLKQKAKSFEGEASKELISYQKDQLKYAKRDFSMCQYQALLDSINSTEITYLGDFHTFDQSGRNLQRLMRILTKENKSFTLAVEFVHHEHQVHIDNFLAHNITELEFLESINYHESWRFPWTYYKHFFEIARKHKMKIMALNSEGTLSKRDNLAAKLLAKELKTSPSKKIFVLFGEYHILQNKIPRRVEKLCKREIKQTIIHQNLDEVYWKLNLSNESANRIVKFNEHEFSLQTSAPWIKYESMIYWFEHLCEDPDFDIHEYLIETGLLSFNSTVPDNFIFLTEELNKSLKVQLPGFELEDFNLHDHQHLDFVEGKLQRVESPGLRKFFFQLIKRGRSFKLPFTNNFYCPSYSMNRLAYLAGVHIYFLKMKENGVCEKKFLGRSAGKRKFIFFTHQAMIGYFSSKLINPYRKCDRYQDFLKQLRNKKTSETEKETLRLCLRAIDLKSNYDDVFKGLSPIKIFTVSRKIGYLLGEMFFESVYEKDDEKTKKILNTLFSFQFDENEFQAMVKILLPRQTYRKSKKKLF